MSAAQEIDTDLLNCQELAKKLKKSRQYVSAMKEAGYIMDFGTSTTITHALAWLRANRDFRLADYIARHRGIVGAKSDRPKKQRRKAAAAGK